MQVLKGFPPITEPRLLVGPGSGDDAAVWQLEDGNLLVQTLDFFTPVVDDPYWFGAIAAANAMSDVYAMGATPTFALNIVAFPLKTLGHEVLREILRGGNDTARKAGIFVAGGHSIDDAEPKYGMVVNGMCRPEHLLTNSGAKVGDVLVLTKKIGVGIVTTAVKRGLVTEAELPEALESMASLNRPGAEAAREVGCHAATDVTGFGLLGHVGGIARESNVTIELSFGAIPLIDRAADFARAGVAPGGTRMNLLHYGSGQARPDFRPSESAGDAGAARIPAVWDGEFADWEKLLVADAQTSGGMVISVPAGQAEALQEALRRRGALASAVIGRVLAPSDALLRVVR